MLSLSPAVRIFVATTPTNMHLSFDRLAALARDVIQENSGYVARHIAPLGAPLRVSEPPRRHQG